MIKRVRVFQLVGAVVLIAVVGVAVWFAFSKRSDTSSALPEITFGKSTYTVGEPVTAIVRNLSSATVSLSSDFSVARQDGNQWPTVARVGSCSCGKPCTGPTETLVYGEGKDLRWDGKVRDCDGAIELPARDPEPGTYRFSLALYPNVKRPDLADASVLVSPTFLLVSVAANTNGATNAPVNVNKTITKQVGECKTDADCQVAGCSNQLCVKKGEDVVSTCEVEKEFACLKETTCGCVAGACAWKDNTAYRTCLRNVGGP